MELEEKTLEAFESRVKFEQGFEHLDFLISLVLSAKTPPSFSASAKQERKDRTKVPTNLIVIDDKTKEIVGLTLLKFYKYSQRFSGIFQQLNEERGSVMKSLAEIHPRFTCDRTRR